MHFPRARFAMPASVRMAIVLRTSLVKTLYYSVRFKGYVIVARRSHICVARRSRLLMRRGAVLTVGLSPFGGGRSVLEMNQGATFEVHGLVQILAGASIRIGWNSTLQVRDRTFFNSGARLSCLQKITIGNDCAIAGGVTIMDSDTHQILYSGATTRHRPVEIGDHCWIGTNATILKGTTLERNVTVAAGSVIAGAHFPEGVMVGGVPARVLRTGTSWKY